MGLITVAALSPEERDRLILDLLRRWPDPRHPPTEGTIFVYLDEYVRCINYLRRGYPTED